MNAGHTGPDGTRRTERRAPETPQPIIDSGGWVPLHLLDRLIKTRSMYGVGFDQNVVVDKGGARVWYVEAPGPIAARLQDQVQTRDDLGVDVQDPFWKITPFTDFA
jgi:hypothetical protein